MYYYLSNGYIGKQDTVTAMRLQNISLEMRLNLLGDIHPDVAQSYHGIGRVNEVSGNYAKAVLVWFSPKLDTKTGKAFS